MLITSKDNPTIKTAHALLTQSRQRKKLGKTVIEGTHLLEAYLNEMTLIFANWVKRNETTILNTMHQLFETEQKC